MARRSSRRRRGRSRSKSPIANHRDDTPKERGALPFQRVLIADSSDVAHRVSRTCRQLGIHTIGLLPAGESGSRDEACDETVEVTGRGPEFLDAVIEAARSTQADAIHPGYVAAHHVELAAKCEAAGLPFIGPRAEVYRRGHDLAAVADAAVRASVRAVRRVPRPCHSANEARDAAGHIGYPVSLRTADGTRWLSPPLANETELDEAWSKVAGVDPADDILVERGFFRPRVIDVTLMSDDTGRIVLVGERETSLRAGERILVDESPSPALALSSDGDAFREALFDSSARVLRELQTTGVGTVSFVIDERGRAMADRVQIGLPEGHDATEMTAGVDLVEWQLRLAARQSIPQGLEFLQPAGHAIVARLVSAGPALEALDREPHWPTAQLGKVRVDMASSPTEPPSTPNALLCRLSTYAPVRHHAVHLLDRILALTEPGPVQHNLPMLRQLLSHESFRAGKYDVTFLARLDE